jgi:hypothetical protein
VRRKIHGLCPPVSALTINIHAANLDLPVRRPAATILNLVSSAQTSCCQGSNSMFKIGQKFNLGVAGINSNEIILTNVEAASGVA